VEGWGPHQVGQTGAWIAVGLGAALVLYAWIAERRNEVRKHRLNDCGFVLLFGASLILTLIRGGPQSPLEWIVAIGSPIVIVAALWRLFHTHSPE
jgi:hypothetical protein